LNEARHLRHLAPPRVATRGGEEGCGALRLSRVGRDSALVSSESARPPLTRPSTPCATRGLIPIRVLRTNLSGIKAEIRSAMLPFEREWSERSIRLHSNGLRAEVGSRPCHRTSYDFRSIPKYLNLFDISILLVYTFVHTKKIEMAGAFMKTPSVSSAGGLSQETPGPSERVLQAMSSAARMQEWLHHSSTREEAYVGSMAGRIRRHRFLSSAIHFRLCHDQNRSRRRALMLAEREDSSLRFG